MAVGTDVLIGTLLWFVRSFISSLICLFLGYVGIKILSIITTKISEFKVIKGDPLGTSLFVSGFLIFAGFVVAGCVTKPFFLSQSVIIGPYFNIEQFVTVILSFIMSLFFGWLFYYVFAQLTPFGVDLDDVNKSPTAVGFFLLGYEIFLGLVIYASLVTPV